MGPDAMILVFWMLSFKPTFSLSSFTFIKMLFSSSLSAIRVVSSVYLSLLIFLPAILIPACFSPACFFQPSVSHVSVYKLNKQGDNIQPWHTPFPIWNQSVVSCPVVVVASWPAYRFHKKQVRLSGLPISWEQQLCGAGVVERRYSTSKVRSSGQEELPHVQGQQLWARGDTPCPQWGALALRRYPMSKIRSSSCALLERPWRDTPRPR